MGVGVEVGSKGILFNGGGCPYHIPGILYIIPGYFLVLHVLYYPGDNLFRDTGVFNWLSQEAYIGLYYPFENKDCMQLRRTCRFFPPVAETIASRMPMWLGRLRSGWINTNK